MQSRSSLFWRLATSPSYRSLGMGTVLGHFLSAPMMIQRVLCQADVQMIDEKIEVPGITFNERKRWLPLGIPHETRSIGISYFILRMIILTLETYSNLEIATVDHKNCKRKEKRSCTRGARRL